MGRYWLPHLDRWLAAPGLDVETWPDWRKRSRSSGGFDNVLALGPHHTAVPATDPDPVIDARQAARRAWDSARYRPVGNFRLARNGLWIVGAAGATNTQGRGLATPCSRGTIPANAGNRYVIAIEAMNDGIGEPWSAEQLDSYEVGCAALIYGLKNDGAYDAVAGEFVEIILDPTHPGDIHAHFEYAPDRKIDPANGRNVPGRYANPGDRYGRWPMNKFRAACAARLEEMETPEMQVIDPVDARHYDSRPGQVGAITPSATPTGKLAPDQEIVIGRHPSVPPGARAIMATVSVADTNGPGAVTAWSSGPAPGLTSLLYDAAGQRRSNTTLIGLADDGTFRVKVHRSAATVVVDVLGYTTR